MEDPGHRTYSVFTFFKKYGCPPCNAFKGKDSTSPWERLAADDELKAAGVEFILFEFGRVKDPTSGRVVEYEIPDVYKNRVRYAPYLELRLPTDMKNGLPYPRGQRRDYESVKKWILTTLRSDEFKAYRAQVSRGESPPQVSSVTQFATQTIDPVAPVSKSASEQRVSNAKPKIRFTYD